MKIKVKRKQKRPNILEGLQPLAVAIESLEYDPTNARVHDERNIDAIKSSLRRFGQRTPLVVQRDGMVVRKGNGTLEAARELGWSEIAALFVEEGNGDASAYAIADNRTAELAEWDEGALAKLIGDLQASGGADGLGFDGGELDELMDTLASLTDGDGDAVDDPGPEPPSADATSKLGDLWRLGKHRLLCGDSSSVKDVKRLLGKDRPSLMATDPPYCVEYTGENRPLHEGRKSDKDWSNIYHETEIPDYREFLRAIFDTCLPLMKERIAIYVWHASLQYPTIQGVFDDFDLILHQAIIWSKPTGVLGHSYYRWQHEPCAFGWRRGKKPDHSKGGQLTTVWDVDWEGKARVVGNEHPTQKPVRLFEIPMEMHTKPGAIVLEPFSGSGSQIIAAEKLNRRCRAMEISPAFVDVAIRRWEKATGKDATLSKDGRTFEEIKEERS